MMMELLKQDGTSDGSRDRLKIQVPVLTQVGTHCQTLETYVLLTDIPSQLVSGLLVQSLIHLYDSSLAQFPQIQYEPCYPVVVYAEGLGLNTQILTRPDILSVSSLSLVAGA